ncbi:MAG: spore cortex biosynthesis protein YabQ [Lachnospiraceae bacterium]|nr:spore cortex biosynthesis protein YabQ [Lachnospiraceae bacterium]
MSFHDEEWRLIGRALLLGFSMSFLYDPLRSLRHFGHQRRGITFLCDAVFTCYTAAASFALLQKYSNGMLRWYAVGAVCLALWLYGKIIGNMVRTLLGGLFWPVRRYFLRPTKIFLTKVREVVIMKIHLKRKEADDDAAGI